MRYRMQSSRESGIVVWMEAPCGIKQPLIQWDSLKGVREFAEMLMDFYNTQMKAQEISREERVTVDDLLRQALGEEGSQTE